MKIDDGKGNIASAQEVPDSLSIDETYFKKLQELKRNLGVDYFNVRFSLSNASAFQVNHGKMKMTHISSNYGFAIQAFINGGWGFVVANDINSELLENKFRDAVKLAKWASNNTNIHFKIKELDPIRVKYIQKDQKPLLDVSPEDKIKYIIAQDKDARDYSDKIVNTQSSYSDGVIHQIIYTSDERIIEQKQSIARIMIISTSMEGANIQQARANIGLTGGFEITDRAPDLGKKSAERAVEMLNAKPVKAGKFDIIIDPLLTGTMIHEAFGHACEADSILAKESQLEGMIGTKVGRDFINVYDDPGDESAFGRVVYDDEGIKARKIPLIEKGVLKNYMHNRESASRMNVEPTGNGRAQNFASVPQVRMRNTYMAPGDWKLEELFEELKNGLLCVNWNYGYTEPSVGEFQFKTERVYLIENGEKATLMRDAAISGIMLEVLSKIEAISKDSEFDDGFCGKGGQSVPVNSGGPYVLLKNMVIGGSS
ncbi:MAG: TldD/PmbA family protein [Promethearchaeota archaeon]